MFAYGTEECAPVDMITGPGNIYVTAAKRAVRGLVGIDAEAGTTEIAVIADATAVIPWVRNQNAMNKNAAAFGFTVAPENAASDNAMRSSVTGTMNSAPSIGGASPRRVFRSV